MADRGDSQPQDGAGARRIERAGAIVAELADAFCSALIGAAEEQGAKAGEQVSAVAEAVRCAAQSLDQSGSPGIARGVDRAADRIEHIADIVRRREWREIATETGDFARRRPGLFGLGAVAVGFLAGRLLTPPAAVGGDGKAAESADGGRPNRQAR